MKIIIIGAGITGLSAAYYLNRKGFDVQIFEASPHLGGLAGFFRVNGTYLEKYYHHSFAGHTDLMQLMKDLEIEQTYLSRPVKTGIFMQDRIYPFVSVKDLLRFRPLHPINRLRLGLTSLIMMQIKGWQKLEQKSALEWLDRYSGRQVRNIIWEPLLKMKFGDDYDRISAAWLWNRVVDRKKSGTGKDVLGYIKGGYKTLFDALISHLELNSTEILVDSPVENIIVNNSVCDGVVADGKIYKADKVISTTSIPAFLKTCQMLPKPYADSLNSISYQGSVCMVLKMKQPLSNYYWINVSDPSSPFVGLIEHTNFISPQEYGNNHLVYLSKYTSPNSNIFSLSDEKIYADFLRQLKKMFPDFRENDVKKYWIFKDRFSQPVFIKKYSTILPDFKTPVKNLYMLNTAQIYPQSRSLNSSISISRKAVNILAGPNVK